MNLHARKRDGVLGGASVYREIDGKVIGCNKKKEQQSHQKWSKGFDA